MSALEIVLLSVLSGLVAAVIITIVISTVYKSVVKKRKNDLATLDKYAAVGGRLFLGDSLTDFYPISEFFSGGDLYNRGIAGDTTKNVMDRLDDCLSLLPSEVILQIGINDLISRRKKVKSRELAERIIFIAKSFDCKVYVLSLYPINKKANCLSPFVVGRATNKRVLEVNAILKELCAFEGLQYIDIYSLLCDEDGRLNKQLSVEGLHISSRGYGVISEKLAGTIKSLQLKNEIAL
jgi:lysophospholipase L1-like esterase